MKMHAQQTTPKGFEGNVARIVTSEDGGPIRRIINGRSRRPTGTFTSIKAGGRAMPHESVEGERKAMWIAEAATCVVKMLAQPHRLEMAVSGRSRPLRFFPDLLLEMEQSAASRLASGEPFAQALFAVPADAGRFSTTTVVLEIKSDADRRMEDADYRLKLRLARTIYEGLGIHFAVVRANPDLSVPDFPTVKRIVMKRNVAIDSRDVEIAATCVEDGPVTFAKLAASLAPSHLGISKAFALHVRRVISIALDHPLGPQTMVHRVPRRTTRASLGPAWPRDWFAIS